MGRHNTDPTMVGTSIALLQERFRQLQKDKQRREKKELLDLLSDSNRIDASTVRLEPENSSTSRDEDLLSLGLNLRNAGKRAHSREARLMPPVTMLWPSSAAMTSASRSFDNPDVDTTLHL